MKCGDKEWKHCRVEKMGCTGCYYEDGSDTNVGSIEKILKEQEEKAFKYDCLIKEIQEKIDKLNKEEQELQDSISEEEREEYSDANIGFDLMHIEIQRSILEELLENKGE